MPEMGIACQLYTVRDLAQKDFADTVKQVARIGYQAVELAGYGSARTLAQVNKAITDHGVQIIASHASIEVLEKNLNAVLDQNETLNNKTIVLSGMPEGRRTDGAGWKASAQALNEIGQACRGRGFDFAYHNHSFEFHRFDGKSGWDILWENTDPDFVKSELDVYWVRHGGEDPAACMDKLGRRLLLLHLKDMRPGPERRFAEVGEGMLDFPGILAAAERAGARWGIVEQDTTYDTPPLDAIRTSFENLKKLGAV